MENKDPNEATRHLQARPPLEGLDASTFCTPRHPKGPKIDHDVMSDFVPPTRLFLVTPDATFSTPGKDSPSAQLNSPLRRLQTTDQDENQAMFMTPIAARKPFNGRIREKLPLGIQSTPAKALVLPTGIEPKVRTK